MSRIGTSEVRRGGCRVRGRFATATLLAAAVSLGGCSGGGGSDTGGSSGFTITPSADSFFADGPVGGPFSYEPVQYIATNSSPSPVDWQVAVDDVWLTVTPSSGTLASGVSAEIEVALDSAEAAQLIAGTYATTLHFRSPGEEDVATRTAHLRVEGPGNSTEMFPLFEKAAGSLDLMGVQVSRTNSGQRAWAPGTPVQEFPGGWVTPGEWLITLDPPRVHDENDGTLSGTLRDAAAGYNPPHQLMGVVVNRSLAWEGWENHGLDGPPEFDPVEWGSSHLVTLAAGDALHVAYGNEIVPFQKREGSDGIVIHCVPTEPEYRGGLWGTGRLPWSREKWNKLRSRILQAATQFDARTDSFHYGPPDGTLPATLPADYQNTPGENDNEQSQIVARWILYRAMGYLQDWDSWSGSLGDLNQLFEFYCNNVQLTFCFSDRSGQHYFYAHGLDRYPPYQINDLQKVLVGAVALGYDPDYEPLYRLLMHLAQRADMTLTADNSYTYNNDVVEGGLSAHRDDNDYTQWLWYSLGATDMGAKGSHNTKVWGPAFWARELFQLPHSSATESMLWSTGPRLGGSPNGHGWSVEGIGPGYNSGYGSFEVQGAMWLWFTGTCTDSQLSRWARRDYLYTHNVGGSTTPGTYYGVWVQETFVSEPIGLLVTDQGGNALLSWSAITDLDLSHYEVYYRTSPHGALNYLAPSFSTSYLHTDTAPGATFYYQVSAVDSDGNEGSLSDQRPFTP